MSLLTVMAGGAIGSAARYLLTIWIDQRLAPPFFWGTLVINVVGSLLIGLVAAWTASRPDVPAELRIFLMVGILGGFTTFSSFSLQTLVLVEQGHFGWAILNVTASVLLCLTAVTAGHALGRTL